MITNAPLEEDELALLAALRRNRISTSIVYLLVGIFALLVLIGMLIGPGPDDEHAGAIFFALFIAVSGTCLYLGIKYYMRTVTQFSGIGKEIVTGYLERVELVGKSYVRYYLRDRKLSVQISQDPILYRKATEITSFQALPSQPVTFHIYPLDPEVPVILKAEYTALPSTTFTSLLTEIEKDRWQQLSGKGNLVNYLRAMWVSSSRTYKIVADTTVTEVFYVLFRVGKYRTESRIYFRMANGLLATGTKAVKPGDKITAFLVENPDGMLLSID